MDITRLLLRMTQILRHPPSPRAVKVGLAVLVVAAVIFGLEWAGLWPDWATAQRGHRPQIRLN